MVSALFRAYWAEGRDIGNAGVLADIGAAAGMDRDSLVRLLASDADAEDILARDQDARSKGVNAVPTFLIAQQYVVSGAQPPDLWAQDHRRPAGQGMTLRPRLSQGEFIALIAMLFATIALSIDAMLPALPEIARTLSPDDPNRAQLVITSFVFGMGLGTLLAGRCRTASGESR